jgi:hypothetical protein
MHVIGADEAIFLVFLSSLTDVVAMHGYGGGHGLHGTVRVGVLYITAGISKESLLRRNDCMWTAITVAYASGRSPS